MPLIGIVLLPCATRSGRSGIGTRADVIVAVDEVAVVAEVDGVVPEGRSRLDTIV
jgi:hypothetical protein